MMHEDREPKDEEDRGFGGLVRAIRRRSRLTQEQLADKSGVSTRTIVQLESGRVRHPRRQTVRLLADALGVVAGERDAFEAAARDGYWNDALAAAPVGSDGKVAQVPRQLPIDPLYFVGRTADISALSDALLTTSNEDTAVRLAAVTGTAGVGKTALVVHWAHRVADNFRDGQLYLDLRGFDPGRSALGPDEAVRALLDAFGVPPAQIPVGLPAQAALWRSVVVGRRVLIVLDNARDEEQVRPLLPGSSACVVVISRDQLSGLVAAEGAYPLTLGLLRPEEARELLSRRLGEDRLAEQPAAVDELIRRCAGLPLALAVMAARAANHPSFGLESLAVELKDEQGCLDAFDSGDPATNVRAALSWSYHTLGPSAARMLRLLGLHPGPEVSVPAAASLAGVNTREARSALAELARAHLLTEQAPGRYSSHDLLHCYAAELSASVESAGQRDAAVRRLLDHYLQTANNAGKVLYPHRASIRLVLPEPSVVAENFVNRQHASAWFAIEQAALLSAIQMANRGGFDRHAWQLAWTFMLFLDGQGYWDNLAAAERTALPSAERLGDPVAQAPRPSWHSSRGYVARPVRGRTHSA
ncbi:helix-turn-helix domain-containing protein [Flindersiella endophytica]